MHLASTCRTIASRRQIAPLEPALRSSDRLCSWVDVQHAEHLGENWSDGVESYLEHARGLLSEFKDVIDKRKASAQDGAANGTVASKPPPVGFAFGGAPGAYGLAGNVTLAAAGRADMGLALCGAAAPRCQGQRSSERIAAALRRVGSARSAPQP